MSKQIRPLIALKKGNPELYDSLINALKESSIGLSKKAQENDIYWMYAYFNLKEKNLLSPPPFFWKDENNKNNKLTITELGRLLLTGWYYDIKDYTKDLSGYVIKAYYKRKKADEAFNDMEIYKVVKHIRENVIYYYQNQNEAKYYLLDKLFNKNLKSLLPPPPEKIQRHEEIISDLTEMRKNQRQKGADYWIKKAEDFEGYYYYLLEILEDLGVREFLSFEDWVKEQEQGTDEYFKELDEIDREYKREIFNDIKRLKL